ncbi:MAG: lysylphosphatidylglycerol synthase transmembrane domain-containing protein [Acidobacteriota bacterium]
MPAFWKSRTAQVAISLLLAGILLALFLRQVRFRELAAALSSVSVGWLALSTAIAISTFALRAVRWTWLLRPVGKVPFLPAFAATSVGFAANNLPGKVGEVLRPAFLARSRRLPFSPLLASIVLERVLDGVSVVVFFAFAMAVGLPRSGGLQQLALPALFMITAVGVVVFAVFQRARTEAFLDLVWGRLPERLQPRLRAFAGSFIDGFATLRDPALFLLVAAGSLAMWFVINVQVAVLFRAFHLPLPFPAAFVVTTFAVLGLMVPTPGGLGSYHVAVQFALTYFYGVPVATASAVALLAHAISFVPITLIGLVFLLAAPARDTGLPGTEGDAPTNRNGASA